MHIIECLLLYFAFKKHMNYEYTLDFQNNYIYHICMHKLIFFADLYLV